MQIRNLTGKDISTAVSFLQAMIEEMASLGGHAIQDPDQTANWFRDHISSRLESPDHLFLIAEDLSSSSQILGMLEASITGLDPIFLPRSSLHIHSIYVVRKHRRSGIARKLIHAAFDWGRERGCEEADLNVLRDSPAKSLYTDIGFDVFQIEMRRKL